MRSPRRNHVFSFGSTFALFARQGVPGVADPVRLIRQRRFHLFQNCSRSAGAALLPFSFGVLSGFFRFTRPADPATCPPAAVCIIRNIPAAGRNGALIDNRRSSLACFPFSPLQWRTYTRAVARRCRACRSPGLLLPVLFRLFQCLACKEKGSLFSQKINALAAAVKQGGCASISTYNTYSTYTVLHPLQTLILCGFPDSARDKSPIVWGQKSDSLGTKVR